MRDLKKNQRKLWYSMYQGKQPVLDANGDETGDYVETYNKPIEFVASLSGAKGEVHSSVFGADVDYTRTILTNDKRLPINKYSLIWYDMKPTIRLDGSFDYETADYIVEAVSDGLDVKVFALRKRAKNG